MDTHEPELSVPAVSVSRPLADPFGEHLRAVLQNTEFSWRDKILREVEGALTPKVGETMVRPA